MAQIDYAFVADYARVESNGTLTAIGASWTYLTAASFPGSHRMAVAGRLRARVDEEPNMRVSIIGPEESFSIAVDANLVAGPRARPYGDGFVGLLFALDLQLPLPAPGLYTVVVELTDDGVSRTLKFEALRAD